MASLDLRLREPFPNGFFDSFLFLRAKSPSVDESLDSIQKFEPIRERRFRNGLPSVITLLAGEKYPLTPDVLRVNLQALSFISDAFPTDFGFRHASLALLGNGRVLFSHSQIDACDRHCSYALFASNETQMFICGRFNADALDIDA
jgi:hypothetical protein